MDDFAKALDAILALPECEDLDAKAKAVIRQVLVSVFSPLERIATALELIALNTQKF